ncbi:helix-turn-helix domain-containing protein [Streptomyces sp. NPDC001982]|uniref:PucR family transcriptional regulator n=1 Tax=Streptomyces sp. NPDC001982 TaxID=3154405 RepID=UPI0033293F4C
MGVAVESPRAKKRLSVVAANVESHASAVSYDVWQNLLAEVPQLGGDDVAINILRASIAENVINLLHLFEHDFPLTSIEAPLAAGEEARVLAQRDIPERVLIRAYRIGHWRLLQWCLDELHRQGVDEELSAATTRRMLTASFGYIDCVAERVSEIYRVERDRWLLNQTAVRYARVREILDGEQVDVGWVESVLGYRIRQHHVGLVLWFPTLNRGGEGLALFDRLTTRIAKELDCGARPLFVPRDEVSSWAWLPLGSRNEVSWERVSNVIENSDPSVQACAGGVESDIEGFRCTHQQALRTQELAVAASSDGRFTAFCDVTPIALMCSNIDDTRTWIWRVLGPLAVDDENCARLRETLRVFLTTGSYTATANIERLHKNTVQYRIRKAEETMGHTVQERHSDLEVALLAAHYLGSSVLLAPS